MKPAIALNAEQLVVRIGEHAACCGLDLRVQSGEHWVILGRNGAGKSTLLSVLAGLRPATDGHVTVNGQTYPEIGPRRAAQWRGWLAQHQGDAFASSVLETALTGRHPHLARWDWEGEADVQRARQALLAVGLHGFEMRDVQTLSGGERQRLAIATLLCQDAALLLLDEPLTHLDLNHQIAVLDLFQAQATQGAAIVSVLHDPGLAWRYASHVLLVHGDGRTEQGPRDAMLTSERLSALYGHPLHRFEINGQTGFLPG
jgi:iron complex transport system ATP-binding protein